MSKLEHLFRQVPAAMQRAIALTVASRAYDPSDIVTHISGAFWDRGAKRVEGFYVTSEWVSQTGSRQSRSHGTKWSGSPPRAILTACAAIWGGTLI